LIDYTKLSHEDFSNGLNLIEELTEKKKKYFQQYDNTSNLLKLHNSNISTIKFHRILQDLSYLHKDNYLNNNKWILKNNGLKYGINLITESKFMHEKIPEWYVTTMWDHVNTKLVTFDKRFEYIKFTKIIWNKQIFSDLLNVVKEQINCDINSKNISKRESHKQEIRNKWLKDIECPHCGGKNIHKKDIRKRKNGSVQRYQCQDCVKIFQAYLS